MSEGTPKRPSFGSKMFGGAKNLTPTKVPSFTMARKGSKAAEWLAAYKPSTAQ